jgi:DNA-binding MarR family transcriptional regulator
MGRAKARNIAVDDLTDLYAPVRRLAPSSKTTKRRRRNAAQERGSVRNRPLTAKQQLVLDALRGLGEVRTADLAHLLDLDYQTASNVALQLQARDLVRRVGVGLWRAEA